MAKFHVRFTNDELTKMYHTFVSLDGLTFSGRGRDVHTTYNIRYGLSEKFTFDFKFNVPEGFLKWY